MRLRPLLTLALLLFQTSILFGQFGSIQKEDVAVGLNEPMDLAFLPDGKLLVAEKRGRIKFVDPNATPSAGTIYLDLAVSSEGERGLTSIALHPNMATDPFVYVFYLPANSTYFRLSRFVHIGATADPQSEEVLWQDPDPAVDCCHYGGGLTFDSEGYLYLAIGDKFNADYAQDLEHASGKILRLYPDGSIPADNPFIDGPGGVVDAAFALGIRNPFRMSYDAELDRIYVGEVGSNYQAVATEDIHVVEAGANFGWPLCEGNCALSVYSDPVYVLQHNGVGASIICGDTLRLDAFAPPFRDRLIVGDYAREEIRALEFDANGVFVTEAPLDLDAGPVVAVREGPDGALYSVLFGSNQKVVRYRALGSDLPPTVDVATVGQLQGVGPLTVEFTATASDPEGLPVDVEWILGDGTNAMGTTVSKTFATNGVYEVRARVSDVNSSVFSDPIRVEVGLPPVMVIATPLDGSRFRALDLISYSASASDPDGDDALVDVTWRAEFLHDVHTHSAFGPVNGLASDFLISPRGHDYHDETGYRIIATATDADGLTSEASTVVWPEKVELTFDTIPSGISVVLDGIERQTPFVYDSLVGFEHDLTIAEKVCFEETRYRFSSWSDETLRVRLIVTPTTSTTIVAEFLQDGPCDPMIESGLVMQFDASRGVVSSAGVVQGWDDLSPSGNHMTAVGDPLLLEGELNGLDAIRLDGQNDELGRFSNVEGLPVGDAYRTIFMVCKFTSEGWGGITYGNWDCGRAFGLGLDTDGDAMVNLWCDDLRTSVPLYDGSWQVMSAVRGEEGVEMWLNTFRIGHMSSTLNTGSDLLRVGVQLDGSVHIAMDVAEILIYDRELEELERRDMQEYLRDKYLRQVTAPVVARWLGEVSSDWHDSLNWSADTPNGDQTVAISSGTLFSPSVSADKNATCRRLALEAGAVLQIEAGAELVCVNGALLDGTTLGSGTLRVTGHGSLESATAITYRVVIDSDSTVRFPVATDLGSDFVVERGTVVIGNALTVAGELELVGGTLTSGGVTAALLAAGDATMRGGSISSAFPFEVQGSWSGTSGFSSNVGTVRLTGAAATCRSLDGSTLNFHNLEIDGHVSVMANVALSARVLRVTSGGVLDLSTYTLDCETLSTRIEGAAMVGPGGTLYQRGELLVPGALSLVGIDGMPAKLVGDGNSMMQVSGSLLANQFEVRSPGPDGLVITSSAVLGSEPFDMRDGRFAEPAPGGNGVLLAIDRGQATSFSGLDFDDPAANGGTNVKTSGPGALSLLSGSGNLIGEPFEDDPFDLISWSPLHSLVTVFTATPGPELATLAWSIGWAALGSDFQLDRWDGLEWVPEATIASDPNITDYTFMVGGLAADVPVTWRLGEDVTDEPRLQHEIATATPWTASVRGSVITVGPSGTFATIQDALDAATNPEVCLLVEPGIQPAFSIDGGTTPQRIHLIGGPTQIDTSAQQVHVHDVPKGAFVQLSDLEFVIPQGLGVLVEDCMGAVLMDEFLMHGTPLDLVNAERCGLHGSDLILGSVAQLSGETSAYFTGSQIDSIDVQPGAAVTTVEVFTTVSLQPGGAWNDLPGLMPDLSVAERVPVGSAEPMTLRGVSSTVWVLVSAPDPAWTLLSSATIELPLLIDPARQQTRDVGVFDGTGQAVLDLFLPATSFNVGREYYMQFGQLDIATMSIRFSNLAAIVGLP